LYFLIVLHLIEQDWLDIYDALLAPFYIILVLFVANSIRRRKQFFEKKAHYKYLIPGLLCKLIGTISLCLIYTYYYEVGGDVTNYFITTRTYVTVLLQGDWDTFADMIDYKNQNIHHVLLSGNVFGYVMFNPSDYYAFFTVLLTIPLCLLGAKSFVCTAILLATVSFIGLWKLYEVFIDQFPELTFQFAITIFFIPSVFFWGSGVLKDTYTLSAIGFYIYGLYHFQILKKRRIRYLLMIIGACIVFIYIKPYFLFALFPGSLLWIYFYRIQRIKNQFFKAMFIPILIILMIAIVGVLFNAAGSYLGDYSLDKILHKAVKTQRDLVRSQYGSNSYDIGEFDANIWSVMGKLPAALNMALFRPYLWDANNPVMLLSAVENFFMLSFSIYILLRVRLSVLLMSLQSHPLLVFSFLFAMFFAFSVGLTTANYGALSRLKIPCIPFYLASLFILFHLNKRSFSRK
jgi:hypothetical protein